MNLSLLTITITCSLLTLPADISAAEYPYFVSGKHELFECKGMPFIDEIVDLSNFEMIPREDELLELNGTIQMKVQLKDPVKVRVDFWRNVRGTWMKLPLSYAIPNFCKIMFNDDEPWYSYTKNLEGAERVCPMSKDIHYKTYGALIGGRNTYPSRLDEGDYKANIFVFHESVTYCFCLEATIFKL